MSSRIIRPITIGIILNDANIFVFEGEDTVKGEVFYRPLGGAIEFGERGEDALAREFKEEINANLADIKYMGVLENIFTYKGEPHHEIVLVYSCRFQDSALYEKSEFIGREDDGSTFKCMWKPLADFAEGDIPLYPEGLREFLSEHS
jgi:8-oxo-dGTP pyrophosphatase MutT (NUDIX family)